MFALIKRKRLVVAILIVLLLLSNVFRLGNNRIRCRCRLLSVRNNWLFSKFRLTTRVRRAPTIRWCRPLLVRPLLVLLLRWCSPTCRFVMATLLTCRLVQVPIVYRLALVRCRLMILFMIWCICRMGRPGWLPTMLCRTCSMRCLLRKCLMRATAGHVSNILLNPKLTWGSTICRLNILMGTRRKGRRLMVVRIVCLWGN